VGRGAGDCEQVQKLESLQQEDRSRISLEYCRELNYDPTGKQRQLYGYGISAKRYNLYAFDGAQVRIVKPSEHGLGMYFRPKEGRDTECEVPLWIKESWQWILHRALGVPSHEPEMVWPSHH